MRLEIAHPTDVERIVGLVNDAYRGVSKLPGWTHETALLAGQRIDPVALRTMIEQGGWTILVMRDDRDVVGCVALRRLDDSTWYLSMLAVDPDQQAYGLGKAIMAGAEEFAREHGARRITIAVINLRASLIAWYERRGYVRTGAIAPFPYDDPTVGTPLRDDLALVTLIKSLTRLPGTGERDADSSRELKSRVEERAWGIDTLCHRGAEMAGQHRNHRRSSMIKVLVIGGGIGGFATALSLHAVGIECEVFEQSRGIRELGVGINLLPHAVKELAALGLLDALDRVAIRTAELLYTNRFGQEIWREPRGLEAGYDYPQLSIQRGKLQGVLYAATQARIGADHIHTAHQLHMVAQDAHGVIATFKRRDGSQETVTARGDVLIAADGIHSTVRRTFYPNEGAPTWNGIMLWRGAVAYPPLLTGGSMLIAGGMQAKLVLYPISNQTSRPGTTLLNWAVAAQLGDGFVPPPRREDWHRLGRLDELLPHVTGVFHLPTVDPVAVIRATPAFYEYPMCDREPLPRWSFGRVTLLGDAAHPMYPVGSNGASQAILDARCVAPLLAATTDVVAALQAYEAARLPATARIVQDNRAGGPERVIDVVEARAPHGFTYLDAVASYAELESIVKGYATMAGFDPTQVNRRAASPLAASAPRHVADCRQRARRSCGNN